MSPAAAAPGWFGKVAMLGDFASRRLDAAWVQACDGWLSAAMVAGPQRYGERWLAAYRAAPVSRFVWGPGVVDAQWWFGVLMPSCDNVGRYYPLLVAQSRAEPPCDRYALDHLDGWWQHAAGAALATLADGASVETFETELADVPPWPSRAPTQPLRGAAAHGVREDHTLPPGATALEIAHGLAAGALVQRLAGMSLWWPLRAPTEAGRCTIVSGLPRAEALAALLCGDLTV